MTETPDALRLVLDAMDGILVHHDPASVDRHFHAGFIQHNPWARDGAEHVREMCAFSFGYEVARWVADGDLVAYLGAYGTPNPLGPDPLLCTDLWRVEDGRIAEHWDVLCPLPEQALRNVLAGGGDGGAPGTAPRQAVEALVDAMRRADAAGAEATLAAGFAMHRTDGAADAAALLAWIAGAGPREVVVHRTLGSGDLVVVHARITDAVDQAAFMWFRVAPDGRIAEMWTAAQPVVPPQQAANAHPHF